MTSRSCTGSDPHVARRLWAILMLVIGILCIVAGYIFGRMARNEVRRRTDVISNNLTTAADNLFKKAKRVSPKAVLHNDPGKMTLKILDIFHCNASDCGTIANYNVADFIKSSINYEVNKLIRSIVFGFLEMTFCDTLTFFVANSVLGCWKNSSFLALAGFV